MLDQIAQEEFMEDLDEEYEDIRQDHYDNLLERKYLSLEEARSRSLKIDWSTFHMKKPSFLGTKVFNDVPVETLIPYIDWKGFFDTWELRGKYPNGRFPKIFIDPTVGKMFILFPFFKHIFRFIHKSKYPYSTMFVNCYR